MMHAPLPLKSLKLLVIAARVVGHRCLDAILANGGNVSGLLTLDGAKAGETVAFQPFDDLIAEHGLQSRRFTDLKDPALLDWARALDADLGIVVGVSNLIPDSLLAVPKQGFIGMHPTLLPEGRGRAPIPWAIIKGLRQTGVSLFWCDGGADTGDLLAQQPVPIRASDTASTLGARTDKVAASLLVKALNGIAEGKAPRTRQDEAAASQWPRRRPEDGLIDWHQPAERLYDWVRALTHPYPGAFTELSGRRLYIWSAKAFGGRSAAAPGTVLALSDAGATVACETGALIMTSVQWDGQPETAPANAGLCPGDRFA
ncbi:methionyl-tRNA formyltransferase [Oceanibacterium hippocampi]|uniref:Bifunctional polymyxin resistance protein ArnA n=1 Tax=Oceanibacterium hippocampi TaxID=745714 RepID=A0A1Y5SDF7_9PROT|nr:methionyl-tRNA formyltransferase [Oceanibacterium hippocampi]SLN38161.1 Bifunctional polymyxin resistance protein ArnA [Oceanibacterium hippocampi]